MDLNLFILYILLCVLFGTIELLLKKNFILLNIILLAFFVVFVANRSFTETADTLPYVSDFKSLSTRAFYIPGKVRTANNYEYGYTLFSQLFKMLFGNNVRIFFAAVLCINIALVSTAILNICKWISKSYNSLTEDKFLFAPFFAIFTSYFGFMYSGIVLREGIALSLILLSFSLLLNKKFIFGLIVYLLALTFHNTAFFSIGVFVILILNKTFKKAVYYRCLFLVSLLYLLKLGLTISKIIQTYIFSHFRSGLLFIPQNKIESYLSGERSTLLGYSFAILFNLLYCWIAIKLMDVKNRVHQKLLQLYLAGNILISILSGLQAMTRVADYYFIYNIAFVYLLISKGKLTMGKFLFFAAVVITNSIIFYRLAVFS